MKPVRHAAARTVTLTAWSMPGFSRDEVVHDRTSAVRDRRHHLTLLTSAIAGPLRWPAPGAARACMTCRDVRGYYSSTELARKKARTDPTANLEAGARRPGRRPPPRHGSRFSGLLSPRRTRNTLRVICVTIAQLYSRGCTVAQWLRKSLLKRKVPLGCLRTPASGG